MALDLAAFCAQLDASEAAIVRLRSQGLYLREIAASTGASKSTVHRRWRSLLPRLSRFLGREGPLDRYGDV